MSQPPYPPPPYGYYPYPPYVVPVRPVTNGTATAGFVLGLIGFLCPGGLLSIIGLFVSIDGLQRSRRLPGRLGHDMAVGGICLSSFVLGAWIVVLIAILAVGVT